MTTSQYQDLALLIVGALAVAMAALALWYRNEMGVYRRRFATKDNFVATVVKSLRDGRGPLCPDCRGKFIEALEREGA